MDIFDIKLEKQMHYNHRQKYFKGKEQQNYFKQAWDTIITPFRHSKIKTTLKPNSWLTDQKLVPRKIRSNSFFNAHSQTSQSIFDE